MKKKGLILFGSICLILTLAALPFMACAEPAPAPAPAPAPTPAPAPAPVPEPIELTLSAHYPATHPMNTKGYEAWAKMVEEVTDGKVKVSVFPGSTLTNVTESYDATIAGACDIAMVPVDYEPERFPLTLVMNQPLGLPNALVSGKVGWNLYQKFPGIQAEYVDVKLLFFYCTSAYQLHTVKKPIHTMGDVKGLLIRSGGDIDTAVIKALGGVPQFIPMPDTYLALQKGVLDGHVSPFGPMPGFKLDEVLFNHLENANFHTVIFAVVMNLNKWNSLPSDIQEAIDEISGIAAAEMFGTVFDGTDKLAIQAMKDKGHTFTSLSPEEKTRLDGILKDILDDWVKEQEANGLPGQDVLDEAFRLAKKYSE